MLSRLRLDNLGVRRDVANLGRSRFRLGLEIDPRLKKNLGETGDSISALKSLLESGEQEMTGLQVENQCARRNRRVSEQTRKVYVARNRIATRI